MDIGSILISCGSVAGVISGIAIGLNRSGLLHFGRKNSNSCDPDKCKMSRLSLDVDLIKKALFGENGCGGLNGRLARVEFYVTALAKKEGLFKEDES